MKGIGGEAAPVPADSGKLEGSMDATLEREIAARFADGFRKLTLEGLVAEYGALGYSFDRTMDCRSIARWVTGPRAGETYPYLTLSPKETDTGRSAFNIEARRDANFRRLMELRSEIFAVSQERIVEV
jgi:hypothetical protein